VKSEKLEKIGQWSLEVTVLQLTVSVCSFCFAVYSCCLQFLFTVAV
jgi:hypothetical protein